MNEPNNREQSLEKEIVALKTRMDQMEKEMQELEFLVPRPIISPAQFGQIGKFILGAIVLIGIFWL
ncbi:hypothetical protein [Sporosarcina sp. 6E9]|uniref:hypothetical protein n=1 Tax=Sporosarcina sp. 6E9 TaxID=2819235 RepID=UPI001ACC3CE2|nr:hypothetical protein [Sporosarcina sp. 6E9]MBO1913193.1 hypothetical protein [Microvirga sp. 3-52]